MSPSEYNSCVDLYADAVYRFILKNLRNSEEARDIVQESFEKLWNKRNEVDGGKARSYLFTTAYHTMIDKIRKLKREKDIEEINPDHYLQDHGHYSDLKEVLNEAISLLPPVQKSVLMLRDYEGYSYEEIGEITGLNPSQVKVYIFRARMFLKEYIVKPENVI